MQNDLSPIQAFDQLVAAVEATSTSDQQQALVDRFMMRNPHSPLVSNNEAIIWYSASGSSIILRGDMLQERSESLQRLGQTTFRYHRGHYEPDARLDYHLLVDDQDIGDPRNPRIVPSGYGPRAELVMPGYVDLELWRARSGIARGTLQTFQTFASVHYRTTHTIWVYLPPGYKENQRYPSVYFHDGRDYLNFAHAAALFDNLIADHLLPACIAVFINPSAEHGRVMDYDLNPLYAQFVCDELVLWIDQHYSSINSPSHRAIIGASFGGLISLYIALRRSDVFGLVGGQSSFASRRNDAIIKLFHAEASKLLRLHLIIGTYETHIGPFERGSDEANFLRGNRMLRDVLVGQGYDVAYSEYHEGHSWGLWRARLSDLLTFLIYDS